MIEREKLQHLIENIGIPKLCLILLLGISLIIVSIPSGKTKKNAQSTETTTKEDSTYYVPDGTKKCGYYECKKCGNRFLSLQTMEKIPCPDCEAEIDYEIGPDESMEDILDTAQLLQKIEGEEEVEKMDALLSLAITGGDCNWI